jgi:sugar phosphate isomerase/epimerase
MLLTLATRSLARRIRPAGDGKPSTGRMSALELPDFTIRQLRLRGLNVSASLFAGWSLEDLDRLRDRADKAGCPCLVLIEDTPLELGHADLEARDAAAERVRRLAAAAHRLSCNALAISCNGPDDDDTFDLVAEQIRGLMPLAERMELNILLAPAEGLTFSADRLTDLIKRIGGFRIGSLPSFGHAAATGDPIGTLRKLAPYAGAVQATIEEFTARGKHRGPDLAECVAAIRSVGFLNTLAIDYVGTKDPIAPIEKARTILQEAIDAEQ